MSSPMRQSSFLPPDDYTVSCIVVQETEDRWYALIAGGWWSAYGSSKKNAINNVTAKFEREWADYGSTPRKAVESVPGNGIYLNESIGESKMDRICHCGVQAGYPHTEHCPFPLFHEGAAAVHRWNFAFKLASARSLGLEDVFTFGEHQNESIGNVIEDAPGYIAWAMDEISNFALDSEAYEAWEAKQGLDDPLEGVFG